MSVRSDRKEWDGPPEAGTGRWLDPRQIIGSQEPPSQLSKALLKIRAIGHQGTIAPQMGVPKTSPLFVRVSKDDGKQSTENQLHELREFCARSGYTVVHEYVDRASGKTADRPQFKKLLEDASKRKFDLVLFWSLDRFSREGVLETLNHLQRLSSCGVGWRSYQEDYFDSCGPFKDVVISLMATLAKQERLRISERTKAGLDRARRAGTTLGRPRLALDRAKLQRLRDRGLSLRQIAQREQLSLSTVVRALKGAA